SCTRDPRHPRIVWQMRPQQLPLFPPATSPRAAAAPAEWAEPRPESAVLAERLGALLREPVEVELTDNAWTMVSYRRLEGRLRFRLHHMFAAAHDPVMRALAGFTGRNRRVHGRAIDEYVRQNRALIRPVPPRPQTPLAPR